MLAETFDSAICSILLVDDEKKELMVSAARCSAPDYLHRMPIRMEGYGWPARPGGKGELNELFNYANLQLNVGLDDDVFDK